MLSKPKHREAFVFRLEPMPPLGGPFTSSRHDPIPIAAPIAVSSMPRIRHSRSRPLIPTVHNQLRHILLPLVSTLSHARPHRHTTISAGSIPIPIQTIRSGRRAVSPIRVRYRGGLRRSSGESCTWSGGWTGAAAGGFFGGVEVGELWVG